MGPRGTVKATKTTKAVQPATGATLENLPELLRALLAADNDVRWGLESYRCVVAAVCRRC